MTQEEYKKMIAFLDSLPKEAVSEDLEEEIKRFAYTLPYSKTGNIISACWVHNWTLESVIQIGKHIAQWQKEQDINKACEWLVEHSNDYLINDKYPLPCGKMSRDWLKVKSEMFDDFRKAMED